MHKAIILYFLCAIAIAAYYGPLLLEQPLLSDGRFHFAKIVDQCEGIGQSCNNYPPLYHRLMKFIIHEKTELIVANFILFLLIAPLIFWWFCDRKPWSPFFFLIGTNFVINVLTSETYPSGLAVLILLIFLKVKEPIGKLGFFILGISTHNYAFFLFAIAWILQVLHERREGFAQWFLPGIDIHRYLNPSERFFSGIADSWFIGNFPAFTILGSIYWFSKKNWPYLVLIVIGFFSSLDSQRSFYVTQLLSLAGFVYYFETLNRTQKIVVLAVLVIYFVLILDITNTVRGMLVERLK